MRAVPLDGPLLDALRAGTVAGVDAEHAALTTISQRGPSVRTPDSPTASAAMCGIRSAACCTSSALGNDGCHSGAGSVASSARSGARTGMHMGQAQPGAGPVRRGGPAEESRARCRARAGGRSRELALWPASSSGQDQQHRGTPPARSARGSGRSSVALRRRLDREASGVRMRSWDAVVRRSAWLQLWLQFAVVS